MKRVVAYLIAGLVAGFLTGVVSRLECPNNIATFSRLRMRVEMVAVRVLCI